SIGGRLTSSIEGRAHDSSREEAIEVEFRHSVRSLDKAHHESRRTNRTRGRKRSDRHRLDTFDTSSLRNHYTERAGNRIRGRLDRTEDRVSRRLDIEIINDELDLMT